MPPLPVIANVFRVAWHITDNVSQHAITVQHFEASASGGSPADLDALLSAHVTDDMWTTLSNSFGIGELEIVALDGTSAAQFFPKPATSPWLGVSSGGAMPAVSGLLKLTTGLRGRSNRGRNFIGPVGEGVNIGGVISTANQAAATTAWDNFANALATGSTSPAGLHYALGVASYRHANFHQATNVAMEHVLATQRRRQSRLR